MDRLTEEQLVTARSKFSYDPETGELLRHFKKKTKNAIISNPCKATNAETPVVKFMGYKLIPTDLIFFLMTGTIPEFRTKKIDPEGGFEWSNLRIYDLSIDQTRYQGLVYFSRNKNTWVLRNPHRGTIYDTYDSYEEAIKQIDIFLDSVVYPRGDHTVEARAYGHLYAYNLTSDKKSRTKAKKYIKELGEDHPLYQAFFPNTNTTNKDINNEHTNSSRMRVAGQEPQGLSASARSLTPDNLWHSPATLDVIRRYC